ncbi:ribosomal protein S12 [Ceratobasidium sp. AG-I]|nr:ribosomal protein S12 [Ceratobasidium sp. AG-I]
MASRIAGLRTLSLCQFPPLARHVSSSLALFLHLKHTIRPLHTTSLTLATLNQVMRGARRTSKPRTKSPALDKCPQRKGVCIYVGRVTPNKPNTARRHFARVTLTNGKTILAYIPGEWHTLEENSVVLLRGGILQALSGVRYRVVRGALDSNGVMGKRVSRSKYGAKKPKS